MMCYGLNTYSSVFLFEISAKLTHIEKNIRTYISTLCVLADEAKVYELNTVNVPTKRLATDMKSIHPCLSFKT